ncbi:MAG: hypothetical protein DMF62_07355 [Acidobacteria bacterium]|nr:MAG: hypothetical protein DMF62_07355 [Acidobacteriota bacterium]
MWFTVSVDPEPTTDLKFHWTTNVGQVTVGQSTRKIGVRSLMEMYGRSATATVKIEGLPNQCPNMASESALLEILLTAVLLDEFSSSINSISIRYLKAAAAELNRNPNNQMYIIEYFPPGTSEVSKKRKKDKIKSFMATTLKFDVDRITIITAEADKPRTKIYRIPPGASNPNP